MSTEWYDGNPATYRKWVADEPDDDDIDRCVAYTSDGFDDRACSDQLYYTCKKSAGNSMFPISLCIPSFVIIGHRGTGPLTLYDRVMGIVNIRCKNFGAMG